ncbi:MULTISPECIES: translesion error-prone DNA polymerase V autoproteolytic subunit [Marinobacterium]|uniref:Translesion error-prone DNA polymerase V autoproteolytic subunit n=2 Tax=Marinobacterium TaxID=48075 RepID=A0ABN1I3B8_9GAMM|nr:translesion error-prone DNA polymerase V autoproteolytic subunit [Marinobacterium sediminicola]ULG70691.1 translesion error-prone DNA polymerase V autoproteolytic subunit [Marinobacterium sediminicola]SMR77236.1 SOS response UmuD protein. Serine peptidase. MEROPS family S24 [Marinobacterium sediminicola]
MNAVILARATIHASLTIPLFLDRVPAGFPSPAQDYIEKTLDLNDLCIRHPAATYFVRAEGDSMIEAGIFSGDILVVDRSLTAEHGDIVIASISGEMTVKQLETRPQVRLMPCNPRYRALNVPEGCDLEIFGVVTNVVHRFRRGSER